ncbi:hypothetical protein BVRB_1g022330 [Beta vulgaris subsp. vulgaris]|nr:hypothetical protein BVRB_1g022330 [Beta vulgaris subsp. vulgaris]
MSLTLINQILSVYKATLGKLFLGPPSCSLLRCLFKPCVLNHVLFVNVFALCRCSCGLYPPFFTAYFSCVPVCMIVLY